MKVPHDEGLADHIDPESCGGSSNTAAEALTGENAGEQLSSEITEIWVPTLWSGREGYINHSDKSELWRNLAESEKLACADAFCARIGRAVSPPELKSWNGRIQRTKISWCTGWRPFPVQEEDTKSGREHRGGQGRSNSVLLPHKDSRKSDNIIVPRKQANKRICRPQRSLQREGC